MEKDDQSIITSNTVKKTYTSKVKIQFDNGSTETIYPIASPNVSPVTPMLMDFLIKQGYVRHINLSKVRSIDMEIVEETNLNIIT